MWKSSNNQGITIIEVLLTISILAVGILGLLQAFPRGISTARELESEAVANHLAQSAIEGHIAASYDELLPGELENRIHVTPDENNSLYPYLRSTTIGLVDQNLNPSGQDIGLKKISVTIAWPSVFAGAERSITFTTLISSR